MSSISSLTERIRESIERSNSEGWRFDKAGLKRTVTCITFHDYMAMCLYDDDNGYYRSGEVRIGKSGDFYTSSAIGSVLGEKLAAYMAALIQSYDGRVDVTEWGAGTGRLSGQIVTAWRKEGLSWEEERAGVYTLVDGNPAHLEAARKTLEGAWSDEAEWKLRFMTPEEAKAGISRSGNPVILFANELLDAFPVHRVAMKEGQLWELGVCIEEEEGTAVSFRYAYMPLSTDRIDEVLERDGISLIEGQELEVNLAAEDWISELGGEISEGAIILIDYGHRAEELAAPWRMKGTLMCYRNHMAHEDPFVYAGEQDITAHVNFTACEHAALSAGWRVEYYGTQRQFLIDQGVLDELMSHDGSNPFGEIARRNRAIRQLILGGGMSETFKVMVLRK